MGITLIHPTEEDVAHDDASQATFELVVLYHKGRRQISY